MSEEVKAQLVGEVEALLKDKTLMTEKDRQGAWANVIRLENAIKQNPDDDVHEALTKAAQFLRSLLGMEAQT